jgi:hypothetical protein
LRSHSNTCRMKRLLLPLSIFSPKVYLNPPPSPLSKGGQRGVIPLSVGDGKPVPGLSKGGQRGVIPLTNNVQILRNTRRNFWCYDCNYLQ